jgi:hypothetical protein
MPVLNCSHLLASKLLIFAVCIKKPLGHTKPNITDKIQNTERTYTLNTQLAKPWFTMESCSIRAGEPDT